MVRHAVAVVLLPLLVEVGGALDTAVERLHPLEDSAEGERRVGAVRVGDHGVEEQPQAARVATNAFLVGAAPAVRLGVGLSRLLVTPRAELLHVRLLLPLGLVAQQQAQVRHALPLLLDRVGVRHNVEEVEEQGEALAVEHGRIGEHIVDKTHLKARVNVGEVAQGVVRPLGDDLQLLALLTGLGRLVLEHGGGEGVVVRPLDVLVNEAVVLQPEEPLHHIVRDQHALPLRERLARKGRHSLLLGARCEGPRLLFVVPVETDRGLLVDAGALAEHTVLDAIERGETDMLRRVDFVAEGVEHGANAAARAAVRLVEEDSPRHVRVVGPAEVPRVLGVEDRLVEVLVELEHAQARRAAGAAAREEGDGHGGHDDHDHKVVHLKPALLRRVGRWLVVLLHLPLVLVLFVLLVLLVLHLLALPLLALVLVEHLAIEVLRLLLDRVVVGRGRRVRALVLVEHLVLLVVLHVVAVGRWEGAVEARR
mmetsp:Transcript_33115/g.87456  ORF Transcript_33115/g.87456 Transcript_33115/m.87456 type:complete len:480 (-) Transcript_33115:180-1619(-)